MPAGRDAVSPIRRPREFARTLGAMMAEQVGPQGRTVLLRGPVDRHAFRTAHRSQTVYHGPVVYAEDPDGRLESASSVHEHASLCAFVKPAAHRSQREYRLAVWTDGEPGRDRVDLEVSPALLDAMQSPPREPERGVVVPAGVGESWAVEEVEHPGSSGVRVLVEAPLAIRHPTIALSRYGAENLPAELRETAVAHAAIEALGAAVDQVAAEAGRDAAAAAWHAESVVPFLCSTYGGAIAGVRVNEDSFIVIDYGRRVRRRACRGDDLGRAGRYVRVQGEHGRWSSCVGRAPTFGRSSRSWRAGWQKWEWMTVPVPTVVDGPSHRFGAAGQRRRRPSF